MDIKIGDTLYWNTTRVLRVFDDKVSLKCKVIDIGKWIWIHVDGEMNYTNVFADSLSKEPLYIVINERRL